ncbi:MAG: IucA/IucC family protein [Rubrobacteraceae bacterium]
MTSKTFSTWERRLFEGLLASRPDLAKPFASNAPEARRSSLHRLLQSFLMENVGGVAERAVWKNGGLRVPLPNGKALHYTFSRRYVSGRFDAVEGGELLLADDSEPERIESPARLLGILREAGILTGDAIRFRSEVEDSAANHALSLVGARAWRRELADAAKGLEATSSLSLARALSERDASFGVLAFFEQLVADGHPLHPCAKLKAGMETSDITRFSPEWGTSFDAPLVAVRRRVCREVSGVREGFAGSLLREHPGAGRVFERALRKLGLEPGDFAPIPVHPWQLENTLPELYDGAVRRGDVVPLPGVRIPVRPLMSFRSLAPVGGGHHIKTAINVRLTNAVRTVSPNSVENTAGLSKALRGIQHRKNRFVVLEEKAGAYYDPPDGTVGEERAVLSRNLAAILREDPEEYAGPGELTMPAATLLARSPLGGPVMAEVVSEFAGTNAIRCVESASIVFFRRYCEVCLPGFLTMMSRYGVGLEGHLQNAIPVFRYGEPVRMLVRDFGGVRILRKRLLARGLDVALYPGSSILAEDEDDLRSKVFYPLFLNHLGELVACLSRTLDADERRYWEEAVRVCRGVYRALKEDSAVREQAASDELSLFAPTMRLKALATMRLLGSVTDYAYAEVPNPLAERA